MKFLFQDILFKCLFQMDPIDRAVQVLFQWNSILTVQDDLLQVVYLKSSRKSNSERFRLDWSLKFSDQ